MADSKGVLEQVLAVFQGLSVTQKIMIAVVVTVIAGGLLSLSIMGAKPGYKVLYSGLSQEDAADVVARLKEQRISYRLTGNGNTIMVPESTVYDTRLSLAGEGLPRGGGVGFEIFDKTNLGTTDFVQRLNYQRALQGELARTIRQFQQVEKAWVHIAMPKDSVFIEDEKPTTASVSVKLRGRAKLSAGQIQSIVNLVASAVPALSADNITVVDTAGRLLFHNQGDEENALSASQLEKQLLVERNLRKKVESLLAGVVGRDRVVARVTAEMDFNRTDITEETYDPEGQVVRSEEVASEKEWKEGFNPKGIPGVKGELAAGKVNSEKTTPDGLYNRDNITRNYEVSRTTRHVFEAAGTIKRLSVAVMVDGIYEKTVDEDQKPILKYKARSPEDMQWIEKLVKNAIGYNQERGDQVEVVNMSFAATPPLLESEPGKMERWREIIRPFVRPAGYVLLAIGMLLFVIKPFFRLLNGLLLTGGPAKTVTAAREGEEAPPEEEEDLGFQRKPMTDKERIYKLAQSDPDRAADLVRRWLREGT